ncbi:hypothetical protein BDK51DRAFT_40213, partial [Blyttiomyces helicus]
LTNAPTTEETAVSKAAFYDELISATTTGADEYTALQRALTVGMETGTDAWAATTDSPARGSMVARGAIAARGSTTIPTAAPPPSTTSAPQSPAPASPTPPHRPLKTLVTRLLKPVITGVHEHPAASLRQSVMKPSSVLHLDEDGREISVADLRMLHHRVLRVVDEYDAFVVKSCDARDAALISTYRSSVEAAERATRKSVVAEYEKLIDHTGCNSQISTLARENKIMKEETSRTVGLNVQLVKEVETLRRFKSSAQAETALLLQALGRRRLAHRALRRRIAAGECVCGHGRAAEPEVGAPERADFEDVDTSGGEDGGEEREEGGEYERARRRGSGDGGDDEGEGDVASVDLEGGDDDDDIDDAEWEEWCRTTTNTTTRPTWNASTATTLLSQKAPPSVIHIGYGVVEGGEGAEGEGGEGGAGVAVAAEEEDVGDRKEGLMQKFHARCRHDRRMLRALLAQERAERKKLQKSFDRKTETTMRLTSLLLDCLDDITLSSPAPATTTTTTSRPPTPGAAVRIPTTTVIGGKVDERERVVEGLESRRGLLVEILRAFGVEQRRERAGVARQHRRGDGIRPADFARPDIPPPAAQPIAAPAPPPQPEPQPQPQPAASLPDFADVRNWLTRATATRPRSAPASRHAPVHASVLHPHPTGATRPSSAHAGGLRKGHVDEKLLASLIKGQAERERERTRPVSARKVAWTQGDAAPAYGGGGGGAGAAAVAGGAVDARKRTARPHSAPVVAGPAVRSSVIGMAIHGRQIG